MLSTLRGLFYFLNSQWQVLDTECLSSETLYSECDIYAKSEDSDVALLTQIHQGLVSTLESK